MNRDRNLARGLRAWLFAILAAALSVLPAAAFAAILNNGYPYGKDMSNTQITLVIETSNTSDTYQWQEWDSQNRSFSDIVGATASTYTFPPTIGKWYRCVVNNNAASRAVKVVHPGTKIETSKPETRGSDGRTWTKPQNSFYITNETMAYMANGTYFDIVGAYTKNGTDYMLNTSYGSKWDLFTNTSEAPSESNGAVTGNADLKALRFSFSPSDPNTIYSEAVLNDGQKAFAFGCDTQIGNTDTSTGYHDKAALQATVTAEGRLRQVAMIGARTVSGAADNAPAFVIRPINSDRFWIGEYSDRKLYVYNTSGGTGVNETKTVNGTANVATLLEGIDSGMTVSWLNVQNGTVQFQFGVGSAQNTGAVGGAIDYEAEKLQDLDANTSYTITAGGDNYSVTADDTGKIQLKTDDYDFFGKTLTISKTGSTPATLTVPPRPSAVLPKDSEITATPETLVFRAEYGHEYKYSANGGESWNPITPSDGSCEITGLTPGSTITIQAIKTATYNSFASNPATKDIILPQRLAFTVNNWSDEYDGQAHVVTVNVTQPEAGATITYSDRQNGTYTDAQPEMKNAGTYTVYCRVEASGYYTETSAGTVTISPRPITVKADAKEKTYGDPDPALTYSVGANGLVAGETLTGSLSRETGETVREYAIGQGSLTNANNPNYGIQFTSDKLRILQKPLHVVITPNGGVYGGTITPASADAVAGDIVGSDNPGIVLTYTGTSDDDTKSYNGTDVPQLAGTYTVAASITNGNYALTSTDAYPTQKDFVVNRSETKFAWLKINEIETLSAEFTYGDSFTVKVKPEATGTEAAIPFMRIRQAAPTPKQMALFIRKDGADTQITAPASADLDGVYTMVYNTTDKALAIGANKVVAKFVGDVNMADYDQELTITLKQRELTVTDLKLEERSYIPGDSTVRILSATLQTKALDTDDVTLAPDTIGTLPGEGSGDYTEVTLPNPVPLAGEHAAYYTAKGGILAATGRIARAALSLQVSMKNWMEGEKAQTPVVTGNLGGGKETFLYKLVTEPDTAYRETPPAKAGRYIVKAVVAETQNYLAGEATAEFDVIAVPALPQTGDDSRLTLWLALCLLTGAGMLGLERRRRNN